MQYWTWPQGTPVTASVYPRPHTLRRRVCETGLSTRMTRSICAVAIYRASQLRLPIGLLLVSVLIILIIRALLFGVYISGPEFSKLLTPEAYRGPVEVAQGQPRLARASRSSQPRPSCSTRRPRPRPRCAAGDRRVG